MTVQAGIETVTDLEVLVGEFEELACESCSHDLHADGPATHYARVQCECGVNVIKAYCAWMVAAVLTNSNVVCFNCLARYEAKDHVTILAPITR
ncbi:MULTISPECIES: hypothetical protein [Paenarthrobacter]|uniref:RING-CH-type domain-containing protein n=1 Tax=Paenarthrobacter ureafaciens TaxID=37931 RepID=A0AAX3EFF8_PAEUR|nr:MULTISPECIES: hypothetical protein [Paenarthrobacter]MDO5865990.1 hypothetical protein [Paenarthrobacter sp. SD-2]MDO5877085.1 hypothetical protein [Paenarthrobacter sp. SD-1]UYV92287.1 hypothetical protein NL395_17460 [Paenarthrobacter ureafaciens]UYV96822.1 hypothetical protein NL394_17490 [Paenarthrobacter ureafaciens]WIV32186.1 hypothetical protein QN084_06135 [Paenarthrobacter sp. R1]